MSPEQYAELLLEVNTNHQMLSKNGKSIKYISASYDNRDKEIYRVELREWFRKDTKVFSKSTSKQSLFLDIWNWLKEK